MWQHEVIRAWWRSIHIYLGTTTSWILAEFVIGYEWRVARAVGNMTGVGRYVTFFEWVWGICCVYWIHDACWWLYVVAMCMASTTILGFGTI